MSKTSSKISSVAEHAQRYIDASGGVSAVRSVKSRIYGVGKLAAACTDRSVSAPALPVRIGAEAESAGLVPQIAQVSASEGSHINNMWENLESTESETWSSICDEDLGEVELVMTDSGKIKSVMVRRPSAAQTCVIDWINFSVLEDTWFKTAREQLISDDQIIVEASRQLEKIFGFGITSNRGKGMNFYRDSWVLGDGMGFVCFGGQRSTMLITLTGQGCLNAVAGWEKRLHGFLTRTAIRPTISRIDLAHDDLDGSYLSVDWAEQQWWDGGYSFKKGGRPPEIQEIGNWKRPSGKGRTLAIGQRTSSKYCRFYEKGKKEGDKLSLWCRCEIEFKNTNTIIRPDVLLDPSSFFVGAYPCLAMFATVETPARMEVKARAQHITVDDSIAVTKRQYGKYIRVFRALFGDKETLDLITNEDENAFPKRLKPFLSFADTGPAPVHVEPPPYVPSFFHFINTVPSFGLNGEHGFA
ncbi:replication initiation factor domain-containing protein [Janthinobacterium sp. J1-1]|uniref:replication initiation factor domain-containing protein n=1 Tax=Janthinobacterium sp. J1-1 TaxID=3065910 RepID=UPI0028126748|nr:replication initiation factor domain-containing protein [Janthinobacterium sp. J1-1]